MSTSERAEEWPYEVGEFVCHQCGNCCRGEGYVELNKKNIDEIAEFLGLSRESFLDTYCQYDRPTHKWHLIDQSDDLKSCIFLAQDNSCRINPVKPQQCRDFPARWRPENIMDFCEGWRAAAGHPPANKRTMSED
ncbi:YkgJ family cysteine cluster protein [bacterium]|nr:YkgJ family cysteine cluster protein [bacterium]